MIPVSLYMVIQESLGKLRENFLGFRKPGLFGEWLLKLQTWKTAGQGLPL
jgi:hypothetical protein